MNNLWFAPIISIILLVFVATAGQSIYNSDIVPKDDLINVTFTSNNIALNEDDFYSGEITGVLMVRQNFNHLNAKVDFYDSTGDRLYTAYDVINQDTVEMNSTFNIKVPYSGSGKPTKAVLTVYNEFSSSEPIYTLEIKL